MRFTQQHIINGLLLSIAAFGSWIVYAMLEVNTIRGDEFLSYLHSDPRWTYAEIIKHIHGGADNSYVHAVLLRWGFGIFGHTILVQRAFSALLWLLGLCMIHGLVKRNEERTVQYILLVLIGFSNFGLYLATDGRFYSLLFFWAAASMYVYTNRHQNTSTVSFLVFGVIQLLGLLTSAIFISFQLLFIFAIVSGFIYRRNKVCPVSIAKWIGCILLSAAVYFTQFKIPYFHSFFLTGFFTSIPFSISDIKVFVSIPFRWLMLPHFPMCSDEWDAILFVGGILSFMVYKFKEMFFPKRISSAYETLIGFMTLGLIFGMVIQILLYSLKGYSLWQSRYYAAVFFVLPIALIILLKRVLTPTVLLIACSFCMMRLIAVEYPKIKQRKEDIKGINQIKSEILNQPKPTLFMEHVGEYQLSVFGLMGNLYMRYPETREKLFLMNDPSEIERTKYFKRLSDWHYPLGLLFQSADTTSYSIISSRTTIP